MKTYKAPFSATLVTISAVSVTIIVGAAVVLIVRDRYGFAGWLLVALLLGAALFVIRGYTIGSEAVLVRRLLWNTRLPVRHLQAVHVEPDAMRASLRLFGNGGLFAFTGLYRNKTLGRYRAYVTDPQRAVVLRFPARTVVLSPEDPDGFAKELTATRAATAHEE